jgi:hypothetical protein
MYSLIRALPQRRLISEQVPAIGSSLLIAELFYKFHSFLLETAAFLATWFVVDLVLSTVMQRLRRWRGAEAVPAHAEPVGIQMTDTRS